MKEKLTIFLDSDVVISSLISEKGAAFALVNNKRVEKYISNISLKEIKIVIKRLKLDTKSAKKIFDQFNLVKLEDNINVLKTKYSPFVNDTNDAHIVAGVQESSANFLITYNLKHFKKEFIKQNLKAITLTPALFLQYLRSRE